MKHAVNLQHVPSNGWADNISGYPARPFLGQEDSGLVTALQGIAQFVTMAKWEYAQLTKSGGDQDYTAHVSNKKLVTEIKKLEAVLDFARKCVTELKFKNEEKDLQHVSLLI